MIDRVGHALGVAFRVFLLLIVLSAMASVAVAAVTGGSRDEVPGIDYPDVPGR